MKGTIINILDSLFGIERVKNIYVSIRWAFRYLNQAKITNINTLYMYWQWFVCDATQNLIHIKYYNENFDEYIDLTDKIRKNFTVLSNKVSIEDINNNIIRDYKKPGYIEILYSINKKKYIYCFPIFMEAKTDENVTIPNSDHIIFPIYTNSEILEIVRNNIWNNNNITAELALFNDGDFESIDVANMYAGPFIDYHKTKPYYTVDNNGEITELQKYNFNVNLINPHFIKSDTLIHNIEWIYNNGDCLMLEKK